MTMGNKKSVHAMRERAMNAFVQTVAVVGSGDALITQQPCQVFSRGKSAKMAATCTAAVPAQRSRTKVDRG